CPILQVFRKNVLTDEGIEPEPHSEEQYHTNDKEDRESTALTGPEEKRRLTRDDRIEASVAGIVEVIVCPMEYRVPRYKKQYKGEDTCYRNPVTHSQGDTDNPCRPTRLCGVMNGYKEESDNTDTGEEDVVHPKRGEQALHPVSGPVVIGFGVRVSLMRGPLKGTRYQRLQLRSHGMSVRLCRPSKCEQDSDDHQQNAGTQKIEQLLSRRRLE